MKTETGVIIFGLGFLLYFAFKKMKSPEKATETGGGSNNGSKLSDVYMNDKPSTPVPTRGYISPRFRPPATTLRGKPSSPTGEIKV